MVRFRLERRIAMKAQRVILSSVALTVCLAFLGLLSGGVVRGAAASVRAAAMLYCQPNIFVDGTPGMSVRVADTSGTTSSVAVGTPCAEAVATLLSGGFAVAAANTPD